MNIVYRYGHHEISHEIFAVLKDRVSSEHYYFWLTSLQELSKGEAVLSSNEDLVVKLSTSLTHYSKALASLRVIKIIFVNIFCLKFENRKA